MLGNFSDASNQRAFAVIQQLLYFYLISGVVRVLPEEGYCVHSKRQMRSE
jgi:hypothetical protein